MEEISSGDCHGSQNAEGATEDKALTNSSALPRYSTEMYGFPALLVTLKGKCLISDCTSGSSNLRPRRRLTQKTL